MYTSLALSVQQGTSIEQVKAQLASTHLHSVVEESTVEAVVMAASGSNNLTMILDAGGKVLA